MQKSFRRTERYTVIKQGNIVKYYANYSNMGSVATCRIREKTVRLS